MLFDLVTVLPWLLIIQAGIENTNKESGCQRKSGSVFKMWLFLCPGCWLSVNVLIRFQWTACWFSFRDFRNTRKSLIPTPWYCIPIVLEVLDVQLTGRSSCKQKCEPALPKELMFLKVTKQVVVIPKMHLDWHYYNNTD